MKKSVVPELPAEEYRYPYASYTTAEGVLYLITQCRPNGVPSFTLWRQEPDGYRQLETAASPLALYEKISQSNQYK